MIDKAMDNVIDNVKYRCIWTQEYKFGPHEIAVILKL